MNAIETLSLWGTRFVDFAGPMLVQASLLIVLLFALDLLLRKHVRAVVRYALWMLLLVKLLLPPSLALPTGLGYWLGTTRSSSPPPLPSVGVVVSSRESPRELVTMYETFTGAKPPPRLKRDGWLLLTWIVGALSLFGYVAYRNTVVRRQTSASKEAPAGLKRLLIDCCGQVGIRKPIRLAVTDKLVSPAVRGLWRPAILLPRQLADRLSALQLRAVLLHELAHVKRGDVWVNYAQTFLQIFYWWHPLLWFANARIRRVREEAVDEAVAVTLGRDAETYPATLLEVAKLALARPVLSLGFIGIMESRSALSQRIQRLLNQPLPKSAKLNFAGLLAVVLFGALLLPMARGQRRAPDRGADESAAANEKDERQRSVTTKRPTNEVVAAETEQKTRVESTQAAISNLKKGLESEDSEARREALERFWSSPQTVTEAENPTLSKALPILIAATKDKNDGVRWMAATAFSEIKSTRAEAIKALCALMLNDKRVGLAAVAASTLKEMGPAAAPAVPSLIETLQGRRDDGTFVSPVDGQIEPDIGSGVSLRRAVLEALGNIGPAAKDAVPILRERLTDKGKLLHDRVGLPTAPPGLPSADEVASLGNRVFSAKALWQITGKTDESLPVLVSALKNDDSFWAADVLGLMGADAESAIPDLQSAFQSRVGGTRLHAALALNKIDPHLPLPLPLLLELLNDPNYITRFETAAFIWKIRQDPQVIPTLLELIKPLASGHYVSYAENAIELLGEIGPTAKDAIPALKIIAESPPRVSSLRTPGWNTRSLAAEALKRIEAKPEAKLQDRTVNADADTSSAALETRFFRLNPQPFLENLRKQMSDTNSTDLQGLVRRFFAAVGVSPPNMIFFNDRSGVLMVRATKEEIDLVQKAIEIVGAQPRQLTIEARFIEAPADFLKAAGLDLPVADSGSNAWSHVLTTEQTRALLQAAESTHGVDLLSAPKITTLSGRQTRIFPFNTGIADGGIEPADTALEVVLLVTEDGYTIDLAAVISSARSVPPGHSRAGTGELSPIKQRVVQAKLYDGQTLVIQELKGGERRFPTRSGKGVLLAVVTPTIIDPSGHPVHVPGTEPFPIDRVPPPSR